ncbi:MAG: T9SS type A sorting domain-containing protein [Bacteroidales bacterium]|nr:T9SS type A sorting domain-containing protein [Bacteroidales bacterium]
MIATYFLSMSLLSFSQSNAHSFVTPTKQCNPIIQLPPIHETKKKNNNTEGALQFAYPFEVHISKNDIEPIQFDDSLVYNITIESPEAYSLNIIFENVHIPDGAQLTILSLKSTDSQTITNKDVILNDIFCTNIFKGDKVLIQYTEPIETAEASSWTITQISHDYINILKEESLLKAGSATCHKDIACTNDWDVEKHAVCKMVIQGVTLCTGTLIANTAKDKTPYLITANHCVASNTKAMRTVFYFGYENEKCGETSISKSNTISGSSLIATAPDGKLDFSLLELSQIPPESFKPYYAGWNRSETIDKGVVCIHHPKGDVKKYSIDYNKPTSETFRTTAKTYIEDGHWKISEWDEGTTEGGSSGAVLFDKNKCIIGTLSGGEADCESPINDFFSKFSKAWNYYGSTTAQLEPWLDPTNSDITICKGYDPYEIDENTLTNILPEDTLQLYSFGEKAQGLWSGKNNISWNTYAEKINTSKTIYDIIFCGQIDENENLDDLTFYIWTGVKEPQTILLEIPYNKTIKQNEHQIYIPLETPITCDGACWIGYKNKNQSSSFSSYMDKVNYEGTMYVKHSKGWVNTMELGIPAHLSVIVHATNKPDTLTTPNFSGNVFEKQITTKTIPFPTPEIFGIDSLAKIKNSTTLFYNNTEKQIAGPNETHSVCFANTVTSKQDEIVRGLKLAVAEIPDPTIETNLIIWNEDFSQELARKTISNEELKKNYFNQIHFDSLIECGKSFAYGICFDTTQYDKNLSLFFYSDIESSIDGYFYSSNSWNKYANYNKLYNIGIQPITVKSKYHYNPDSTSILQYPITNKSILEFNEKSSAVFYPSICKNEIHIQFKNIFHNSVAVTITDSHGTIVLQGNYKIQDGTFNIPINALPQGTYIIQVQTKDKVYKGKFLCIK